MQRLLSIAFTDFSTPLLSTHKLVIWFTYSTAKEFKKYSSFELNITERWNENKKYVENYRVL